MQGQSFDAGVYQLEVGAFGSARRRVGVCSCYVMWDNQNGGVTALPVTATWSCLEDKAV